jgi:hypothetical protein
MRSRTAVRGPLAVVCLLLAALPLTLLPPSTHAADEARIRFGGALRYNAFVKTWDEENKEKLGDIQLDTFRIEADGDYKDLVISSEYRIYAGYHMLHHGYVGWKIDEDTRLDFGVHQVPFGIQPYQSHNWFFDVGYYVGLEDDYDLGLKLMKTTGPWSLQAAFYKNDEGDYTGNSLDSARYSYDIVNADLTTPTGDGVVRYNEEINQGNVRVAYRFDHSEDAKTEVGASFRAGQIYNSQTMETGAHFAWAVHANGDYGPFNVMAQAAAYDHDLENPEGDDLDELVAYGAYDAPYWIAAEGSVYLFNVAWTSPWSAGPLESFTFYNDWSVLVKAEDSFEDTYQNVLGCAVGAGPLYIYVDAAMGKNHPWLGGSYTFGLGPGDPDAAWETRYNINFGYYF